MARSYRKRMFDVGESLRGGLVSAGQHLRDAQDALARAGAGAGSHTAARAMADTAQSALFSEALMAAIKSRLAEIKNAAK